MTESIAWLLRRLLRTLGWGAIFISYRRNDSSEISGRIYDSLAFRIGKRRVFKDVNSIPPGMDFRAFIDRMIPCCKVMLVVIGPGWLEELRGGNAREDLLRKELTTAFAHRLRVIPVLVGGASVPEAAALPHDLHALLNYHAISVRGDPDFHHDIRRLIAAL